MTIRLGHPRSRRCFTVGSSGRAQTGNQAFSFGDRDASGQIQLHRGKPVPARSEIIKAW